MSPRAVCRGFRVEAYAVKVTLALVGLILMFGVGGSRSSGAVFRGLGFLDGGTCSEPRAVSADGMVAAGTACTPSGVQAFRWRAGEGMVCIPLPSGLTKAWGVDISADGRFVLGQGRSSDRPPYGYEGFYWDYESDSMDRISVSEEERNVYVTGMSGDASVVVGNIWTGDARECTAYRWRPGGEVEALHLGYEGDLFAETEAVSGDGRAIVSSRVYETYPYRRMIRWTAEQAFMFGANTANAASGDGSVVVGRVDNTEAHLFEAYRWTADGGVELLGRCLDGHHSHAMDVSGDGSVIVGYVQSDTTDEQTAMIWDAEHGMRLLKDVLEGEFGLELGGWRLSRALAVSADGSTIVGDGRNPENEREGWWVKMSMSGGAVCFADAHLKEAVEDELGIVDPNGFEILSLTWLDAGHLDIGDIGGLEHARNLRYLDVEDNDISDISALAGLVELTELDLDFDQVGDITALAGLKNLRELDLEGNRIGDIGALSGLAKMEELDLEHNMISDISALSEMEHLVDLELEGNPLSMSALCTDLVLIEAKNPGMVLTVDSDPNPLTSDCSIGAADLMDFGGLWLEGECDETNNWCGGADTDRSGRVDLKDFAEMAEYWLD